MLSRSELRSFSLSWLDRDSRGKIPAIARIVGLSESKAGHYDRMIGRYKQRMRRALQLSKIVRLYPALSFSVKLHICSRWKPGDHTHGCRSNQHTVTHS